MTDWAITETSDGYTIDVSPVVVLDGGGSGSADGVTYDPTASGLTATDVQAAIDELDAALGTAGAVTSVAGRTGAVTLTTSDVSGLGTAATTASSAYDAAGAASSAVFAHEADTTSVHGIVDTSVLATATTLATAVSNHAAASDPHGDRAYAVAKVGDTMSGALGIEAAATSAMLWLRDTDDTAGRKRLTFYNDGRIYSIGDDSAVPTFAGSEPPQVYIGHTLPGSAGYGTGLLIRGSVSSGFSPPMLIEDWQGLLIMQVAQYGGVLVGDAVRATNNAFRPTQQAGFMFRTQASGALLHDYDPLSLVLGMSSREWTGDAVAADQRAGLFLQPGMFVFQGTLTAGSRTITVTSGLADATVIPAGSYIATVTVGANAFVPSVPVGANVASTTTTTITWDGGHAVSGNATTVSGTFVCFDDTLKVHAYNGLSIGGNNGAGGTAFSRVSHDSTGLIMSGDDDQDGWRISITDKTFAPTSTGAYDIGNTAKEIRQGYYQRVQVSDSLKAKTTAANVGTSSAHFGTAYVDTLAGTSNRTVATDDLSTVGLGLAMAAAGRLY